jgi:lysophospholipase L1-like esterase
MPRVEEAADREPSRGKRLGFWLVTLLGPAVLLAALLQTARTRLGEVESPALSWISQTAGRAALEESARTEVRVVDKPTLKGMVQPSRHDDLVYELKPNRSWVFLGTVVRTDARGFRERTQASAKPPGRLRVLGIGDSIMWGWGISEDQTYLRLLEEPLTHALRVPVDVVNLAVPTYNTLQEAAILERYGMAPSPDLVVVGYTMNDGSPPAFGGFSSPARLKENEQLLRRSAELLPADLGAAPGDLFALRVAAGFERIRSLTEALGIPVVVLVYPYDSPHVPRWLAEANGFHYLDLYPAFEALARERGVDDLHALAKLLAASPADDHPGPAAHRMVFEALLPRLTALLAQEMRKRSLPDRAG